MAGLARLPAARHDRALAKKGRETVIKRWFLPLMLALACAPAIAQEDPVRTASAQLTQAEDDLRAVDRAMDGRVDKDARDTLRAKVASARETARAAAATLADALARVDARIAGLGSASPGQNEAPEIRQQRTRLAQEHAQLDAAVKRGNLAAVEAQQLVEEIDRSTAEQLNQTLWQHVASPLTPAFWSAVLKSVPRDLRRIDLFLKQGGAQIGAGWRGGVPWQAMLGLALAFLLLFPARVGGRALGKRYLIGSAPGHRVRRSAFAIWSMVVGTVAPLLAAIALVQGLRWAGLLPERWSGLLDGFVAATGFGAFTGALAGAVLMRSQPSWRIAPISDETARRVRPLSWLLAGLAFVSILIDAFNQAVGASRAAVVTTEALEALLHLALIGALLLLLGRLRVERIEREGEAGGGEAAGAGLGLVTLVAWLLVGLAALALLFGYVAFSIFVARLMVWGVVLGSTVYLLMCGADDAATSVFNRESRIGAAMVRAFGIRGSLLDQFGLLLSAALRIVLVLVAFSLLLSPFGAGGIGDLFGRLGAFAQGVQIGGLSLSPGVILRSIVVLVVGLALVRAFQGWLENRYLPVTDLDGSGRNSVSLIARYVGLALAVIWALASLGIGVERIALLLSALSVGIGFGLQAITQNFVSGLILLAERPIKIGDWVRVGTDEGDVKRISVRSTEIALADHSTLIVPNSELITKSVLNKTLGPSLGRIQIQFSVLLGTDTARVRDMVLEAFTGESAVLADPAPAVFIDAITDGRVLFNCFAHVPSPRDAYGARSNILMTLLARFRDEGIDIGTVPQRFEVAGGGALPIHETAGRAGDGGEGA